MKLKFLRIAAFITLSLFITLSIFAATSGREFVGYRHKGVLYGQTLPNGVKDLGGGLLSDDDYGVTRFARGKKYMLWLEKIVRRNAKGEPNWEVKDVLMFPNLKKNQEFLFSYSSTCKRNGRENLDLIVMAELAPKTKNYKVLKAWRANVKNEKFEKISVNGIVCQYKES
ncbi:MAG: hypothetical protein LH614_16310 [Pyrinomonadaceae bacterium]|nr:hypothetical protein [Pyrinomonadaceae bacterium]